MEGLGWMTGASGDRRLRVDPMRIEQFRFGEIIIGGRRYTDDLLVLRNRVQSPWWRKRGHRLQVADLREVLLEEPEVLIVGTGAQGCMKITPEVVRHTRDADIELLEFDTRTACQTYNHLLGKRRVVAALHLTC
jgi:hypothetical protein